MGDGVFISCTSLITLDFSTATSLQSTSYNAFAGCSNLVNIIFSPAIKSLGFLSFYQCGSLVDLDFTTAPNLEGFETSCFIQCWALANITFHHNIIASGATTFAKCTSLKLVDLSPMTKLKKIGSGFVSECSQLVSVIFPPQIEIIESEAFQSTAMEVVDLSMTNIAEILNRAFYSCDALHTFKCGMVPLSPYYGDETFLNCRNLLSFQCHIDSAFSTDNFLGCDALQNVTLFGSCNSSCPAVAFFADRSIHPVMALLIVPCEFSGFTYGIPVRTYDQHLGIDKLDPCPYEETAELNVNRMRYVIMLFIGLLFPMYGL